MCSVTTSSRRWRFTGRIAGVGSVSGVRIVIGDWDDSPLGAFADAMVERADGHRVLIAPRQDVADFVASTYDFDEVRVEPLEAITAATWMTFASTSLSLAIGLGPRPLLGWALRMVPRPVATSPAWSTVTDPVARTLLRGVRTRGRTGSGPEARHEWYGATDHHRVASLAGWFDGSPVGGLAPVQPPPSFGFSSSPTMPSVTQLVTTVETA